MMVFISQRRRNYYCRVYECNNVISHQIARR